MFVLALSVLLFPPGTAKGDACNVLLSSTSSVDVCLYVIFATRFSSLAMAL